MIKLMVDAKPFLAKGGISNYVVPLVSALFDMKCENITPVMYWRLGLRRSPEAFIRSRQIFKKKYPNIKHLVSRLPDRLIDKIWRYRAATDFMLHRPDVYISTTTMVPAVTSSMRIGIIHDLAPIIAHQHFDCNKDEFFNFINNYVACLDKIIAVSNETANALISFCGVNKSKISVIYPGLPRLDSAAPSLLKTLSINKPYILYLGSIARNKNIDGLISCFSKFLKKTKLDWLLILAGKFHISQKDFSKMLKHSSVQEHIIAPGFIEEPFRSSLIRNSEFIISLSWYEGFGLPSLEAMAAGKAGLFSNRGAAMEVIDNNEMIVDPECIDTIVNKMSKLALSPLYREKLALYMKKRGALFDINKSAKQLRDIVESSK